MTLENPTLRSTESADESRILALLDRRAAAIRAKRADDALAALAADVVVFDLAPPLRQAGAGARGRAVLQAWFDTWRGPIGWDRRDLRLTVEGGLAVGHGYLRISGTKTDGEEVEVWARQTLCLRRTGADWRIVHEHISVPFHMDGSLRAAVDLQP